MRPSPRRPWARASVLFLALCCGSALAGRRDPDLDRLQRMSPCELRTLFESAEVGRPISGRAEGRLLFLTDRRLPRVKVRVANAVWEGKAAREDGWFVNRWAGNVEWIDSCYVIGPSWVDGKPAIVMEYAPGTPLFANMHDELREICPGLYLGPVYERCPCPKLRGYIALKVVPCGCRR
jgi:hypothetical protein